MSTMSTATQQDPWIVYIHGASVDTVATRDSTNTSRGLRIDRRRVAHSCQARARVLADSEVQKLIEKGRALGWVEVAGLNR